MMLSSCCFLASCALAFLAASSSFSLSFGRDWEYREAAAGWLLPRVELGRRLVRAGLFGARGPADSQVAGPMVFLAQSIAGSEDSSLEGV